MGLHLGVAAMGGEVVLAPLLPPRPQTCLQWVAVLVSSGPITVCRFRTNKLKPMLTHRATPTSVSPLASSTSAPCARLGMQTTSTPPPDLLVVVGGSVQFRIQPLDFPIHLEALPQICLQAEGVARLVKQEARRGRGFGCRISGFGRHMHPPLGVM